MPLINQTYHHEIKNRHLEEAIGSLTAYSNTLEKDLGLTEEEKRLSTFHSTDNWHKFTLMHSIKNVLETKVEHNSLNFKTFMNLMEVDYRTCDPNRPLCFMSRYFDLYIQKQINHHRYPMNYRDLSLI